MCVCVCVCVCVYEGDGNLLQCSCLENPMDREAWQAIVHGVTRVRLDLMTNLPYIFYDYPERIIQLLKILYKILNAYA